jgi:hypothetical protein
LVVCATSNGRLARCILLFTGATHYKSLLTISRERAKKTRPDVSKIRGYTPMPGFSRGLSRYHQNPGSPFFAGVITFNVVTQCRMNSRTNKRVNTREHWITHMIELQPEQHRESPKHFSGVPTIVHKRLKRAPCVRHQCSDKTHGEVHCWISHKRAPVPNAIQVDKSLSVLCLARQASLQVRFQRLAYSLQTIDLRRVYAHQDNQGHPLLERPFARHPG